MKTSLYRFFDRQGNLLYIGISKAPLQRLLQHREEKLWWEEIGTIKLEFFETREEALFQEFTAIQAEQPRYNIHSKKLRQVSPKLGNALPSSLLPTELIFEGESKLGWNLPDDCPHCELPVSPVKIDLLTGECFYSCPTSQLTWTCRWGLEYNLGKRTFSNLKNLTRGMSKVIQVPGGYACTQEDLRELKTLNLKFPSPLRRCWKGWDGKFYGFTQNLL